MKNSRIFFGRLSWLASVLLVAFIGLFFWMVFFQIDQKLNSFNLRVLKIVNNDRSQLIQHELNNLGKLVNLMDISFEDDNIAMLTAVMRRDSLYNVFSSTVFWHVGHPSQDSTYVNARLKKVFSRGNHSNEAPSFRNDTIRFVNDQGPKLEIYRKLANGLAYYEVDLIRLHHYFEGGSSDGSSYFELYDSEGHYLFHPDTDRIGLLSQHFTDEHAMKMDTIVNSDFIGLPFVRHHYPVKGIFSSTILYIYVPFILTDVEVQNIVDVSFVLCICGIILMMGLLFFLNREQRKSERLAMYNLAYQKEEATLRFENLKQKMDPHFLFNALGSLQQLIGKDTKLAQTFVGKMARVYRKFLRVEESGLSTVREDIILAKEYYFLQKIRFGDTLLALNFHFQEDIIVKQIPRFSLQILIENAIKHNEISIDNPLRIDVYLEKSYLYIENTFTPRVSVEESTGYGTLLIANVYDYYNVKGFYAGKEGDIYRVVLPLI